MQNKFYKEGASVGCDKSIERPLCRQCLKEEVEEWLVRRNAKLLAGLRRKTKEFFSGISKSKKGVCIICKKAINGCSHCYINYIQEWIGKKSPDLIPSFKLFFNF